MGTLLLVDDASYMRRLIGIMAKKGGHEIVGEAETGEMAIDLFVRLSPDLVILDILMPDMDGLAVLKRIKELNSDARVIMCTASEQSHHVQEALSSGAQGYIVKPFTQESLNEKINTALSS
ncbi:MAG TPA: response regulator [Methanospirillum sp.]|uniref:response regulator n=1 Tax=Methanospirillum sp. TaxID=45200 RepID=UPI002BB5BF3F|nr:response regulator [Methanospirillum sp.]HWQ65043.1 response regulator [Methanospirillum sp.]